jgi:hypothetical protein
MKTSIQKDAEGNTGTFGTVLPHVLVLISIILFRLFFYNQTVGIFLVYIGLIAAFVYFKIDGKVPIGYAIVLLIIEVILVFYKGGGDASNQLLIYFLLVVGIIINVTGYLGRTNKRQAIGSA